MKKPVMFYLTAEQKERLVTVARRQGRTISEVMRRSIDSLIDRESRKTPFLEPELAEKEQPVE